MSTDHPSAPAPVTLVAGAGAEVATAVQVLGDHHESFGTHAVVGGIAVLARVAQAYRATGDIDSAVPDPEASALAVAVASGGRSDGHRVYLDSGIKIDFIDASVAVEDALQFKPADAEQARCRARAVLMRVAIDTEGATPASA